MASLLKVEYAANNCKCKICKKVINKGDVRLANEEIKRSWHHVECYMSESDLSLTNKNLNEINGYENLNDTDKDIFLEFCSESKPVKKEKKNKLKRTNDSSEKENVDVKIEKEVPAKKQKLSKKEVKAGDEDKLSVLVANSNLNPNAQEFVPSTSSSYVMPPPQQPQSSKRAKDAPPAKGPKKTKKTATKSKKTKVKPEPVDDDEEEEDEEPPVKKSTKKAPVKKEPKEEKTAIVRSLVKKGRAAVDGLCPIAVTSHVLEEEAESDDDKYGPPTFMDNEDTIWDCLLNQTNIQYNNNKYYIIQLLKDDGANIYNVWMRWGRVGLNGQNCLKPFGSNLSKAKSCFESKFRSKTSNEWVCKSYFMKEHGKYDLVQVDYDDQDVVDAPLPVKNVVTNKKVECKLNVMVQNLIELICDVKAMEDAVVEMKYDPKKAPLGKLTAGQVKSGYSALKTIDRLICNSGKSSNKDLLEACNAFYTRIPHYFGMKVPPMIRTKAEVQEKINLLQALGDIQAAMEILSKPIDANNHPTDQHYNGLNCEIQPLNKTGDDFKLLSQYLTSTHGATHSMYKMHLEDIYEVTKNSEQSRFKNHGNRMLLWHGSRLTNWAGILSQGLKIAPPEAPATGYMFGKGIYFADMSSKSANYCIPSMLHDTGLLVLCEVSLGKSKELLMASDEANKLKGQYQSVKAIGRTIPKPENCVTRQDGVRVPLGPGVNNPGSQNQRLVLQYNEYIVYDVAQVQMKYLFKVKFSFN